MTLNRVVVTGMGMVSPLGNSVQKTWKNLLASKSGITQVDTFDTTECRSKIAGLIRHLDKNLYLSPKDQKKLDPFIHYAVVASEEAVQQSGLKVNGDFECHRAGVLIGSGIGGIDTIEKNHQIAIDKGAKRMAPFFIPSCIINMASGYLSMRYGFKGPNMAVVSACTTGTHAIGLGARMIKYGDADVMLVGGAEHATTLLGIGGFAAARALSTRNNEPEQASRPWDKDRDGFVLSDGSALLVLESYEHAKKRGAPIFGEIAGFGMSSDAYHMTLPHEKGEGAKQAMQLALKESNLSVHDVDYINAHATSTSSGDRLELEAIASLFDSHKQKLAISSTKSMLGHMLGAAGAAEAIISLCAIHDQAAPATLNLDSPEDDLGLNLVPHVAQNRIIDVALSNSFGFGGTNGSLIFKRVNS